MRFSVVTPSFRNSAWLKLCIASVADQGGELEHIVQDAGSDDGTLDWLPHDRRVRAFVEKDRGMYDAVNRGLRRATGDILAYLNCDEQFLPGALKMVRDFFEQHPGVDVLFGDIVIVNTQGEYLFHRKVQTPLLLHTQVSHLSTLSCAMFFRRKLIARDGLFFDEGLRASGDGEWVLRLLRRKVPMAALGQFTSIFAATGDNLGAGEVARREREAMYRSAPLWAQWSRPLIVAHHRVRRLLGGMYSQEPFTFSLYTHQSPDRRVSREVSQPNYRWKVPA